MLSHVVVGLSLHPLELLGGTYDWLILLVVAVLLFGGTRLAGLGKGAGRAIREFKEETGSLRGNDPKQLSPTPAAPASEEASGVKQEADQKTESA